MTLPRKDQFGPVVIVTLLGAVLVVLGALQYRWSAQISEATSTRLRTNLQMSLIGFRDEFNRELSSLCVALQLNPRVDTNERWSEYAQRYQQWSRSAAHPALVTDLYVWRRPGTQRSQFQRLNTEHSQFEPVPWPSDLERLRNVLQSFSSDIGAVAQHHSTSDGVRGSNLRPVDPERIASISWAIDESIPALVNPIIEPAVSASSRMRQGAPVVSWLILKLDRNVLRDQVFPEVAARYFGGADGYRVAVIGGEGGPLIYSSDAGFDPKQLAKAEGSINLFGPPTGAPGALPNLFLAPPPSTVSRWGMVWPLRTGPDSNNWQLVVQRRGGSLESFIAATRRRNLAISFGVLLVLAATMTILVIASRRAQRLAMLQMNFVAAVSHELRTPLTVISSAAENIADGVVDSKEQIIRYGTVIKNQSRQLIRLVEQVLSFAATRRRSHEYHIEQISPTQLVDAALQATADLIHVAGCTVQKEIEDNLPSIEGDPAALSQCLQNLITNAVKYGGDMRWLAIRALRRPVDGTAEIQISVEDKGIGIPEAEVNRIFEPFYRGAFAAGSQIRGTGLGLPLAKSIAEAMNGRITVSTVVGKGSTFVLHLPVAAQYREEQGKEACAAQLNAG